MRILHIISGLGVGGAEKSLCNLIIGSPRDKYDHLVISLSEEGFYSEMLKAKEIQVFNLDMRSIVKIPIALYKLRKILKSSQPESIHGWMNHGNLIATLAGLFFADFQPKIYWNIRQSLDELDSLKLKTRVIIRLNRFLSKQSTGIIYNSERARVQHEKLGYYSCRSHVIPNGFDIQRYMPDDSIRQEFRKLYGIQHTFHLVAHVGRFHPMKDHASFLRAALIATETFPSTVFVLAGKGICKTEKKITALIPAPHLNKFIFLDEIDDVKPLFQAADVFCLSSVSESFPNVLGEAMACGVPCVTTDAGDAREIVGDAGLVVNCGDFSEMANGICKLLSLSRTDRMEIGQRARDQIVGSYSVQNAIEKYLQLIG